MTDVQMTKRTKTARQADMDSDHSSFVIRASFVIRHSSFVIPALRP